MNTQPPRRPDPTDTLLTPDAPPPQIAWADGQVIPASEATIPLMDDGFQRGDGIFEAMLVRGGSTHALAPHLERMRRSAHALDMQVPDMEQVVADLLAAWGDNDGTMKLILTRGGNVRGLMYTAPRPATITLAVFDVPWQTALSGVKTLSYVTNQWITRQAAAMDADEGLITHEGQLFELPNAAICLVHDGVISTPDPTRLPILDSITVKVVREVAEVNPAMPTIDDLRSADELFIVSVTRLALPVHTVLLDDEALPYPAPGPISERVRAALDEHISATLDPRP